MRPRIQASNPGWHIRPLHVKRWQFAGYAIKGASQARINASKVLILPLELLGRLPKGGATPARRPSSFRPDCRATAVGHLKGQGHPLDACPGALASPPLPVFQDTTPQFQDFRAAAVVMVSTRPRCSQQAGCIYVYAVFQRTWLGGNGGAFCRGDLL